MSTFNLIDHTLEAYCEAHTSPENELLHRLNRQTNLETVNPRMLSDQLQGQFLNFISKIMRPSRILEIGTFTGYSALCLADGLAPDGELHTIEINEEYEDRILEFFSKSPNSDRLFLHIGDALQLIPNMDVVWDLVFIDADKEDYQRYYETVLPKVRQGGFILVDNVLWNGKVIGDIAHNDRDTRAIDNFNTYVQQDPKVRNLLLPFRDGIMMIEKL